MAREAGGLQTPKLQWSSRNRSPTKDSRALETYSSRASERQRERALETSDGLVPLIQDPRKNALKNSLNQRTSPPGVDMVERRFRSEQITAQNVVGAGERKNKADRDGSLRKEEQGRKRDTNIGADNQEDENPFLEKDSNDQNAKGTNRPSVDARRAMTRKAEIGAAGATRARSISQLPSSIQSHESSSTTSTNRVRAAKNPFAEARTASRPAPVSTSIAAKKMVSCETTNVSSSPSATRMSSRQTNEQIASRVPATELASPEKRIRPAASASASAPNRSKDQHFQISHTSEDALKRIEKKLKSQVSSSSKYQSAGEGNNSHSLRIRRDPEQFSPPKAAIPDRKEQDSRYSKFGTFPSVSSFGDENDSIQSLAPTTPSPGALTPSSSPNTVGSASKVSPSRRGDYFGRLNSSPCKLLDLQSLKPSPGKAKRGCFKEDEISDEESLDQLPSQVTSSASRGGIKAGYGTSRTAEILPAKSVSRPSLSRGESLSRPLDPLISSSPSQGLSPPSPELSSISRETTRTLAEIEAALKSFRDSSPRKRPQTSLERRDEAGHPPQSTDTRSSTVLSPHRRWRENKNDQIVANNNPARDTMDNPFFRTTRATTRGEGSAGGSSFMEQLKEVNRSSRKQEGQPKREAEKEFVREAEVKSDRRERRSSSHLESESAETKSRTLEDITRKHKTPDMLRSEEDEDKERKRLLKARRERRRSVPTLSSSSSLHEFADLHTESQEPQNQPEVSGTETTAPQSKEERRATKAARRKSLYSYTPTKKDEWVNATQGVAPISPSVIRSDSVALTGHELSVAEVHPSCRAAVGVSTPSHGSPIAPKKATPSKSSTFLRGLIILVDVRDQDGSDACHRWVELLKAAGAKVYLKPPSSTSKNVNKLTHIVYKAGKNITRTFYRGLNGDCKPLVVGVGWVLKSMESGTRVDEKEYIVELGKEAIFSQVSSLQISIRSLEGKRCAMQLNSSSLLLLQISESSDVNGS